MHDILCVFKIAYNCTFVNTYPNHNKRVRKDNSFCKSNYTLCLFNWLYNNTFSKLHPKLCDHFFACRSIN